MAFNLSPVLNTQQLDANGDPRAGALITTYLAGTLTAVTTYKTSTGTAHSNPIVLDSSGNYPNGTQLWLLGGLAYKFVITDSNGANSRTYDNIVGVGDTSTADEWVVYSGVPTYISATSFSLAGDQTNIFQVGRRVKSTNTGGTTYSTITISAFAAGTTTVTVLNTSGVLDSGLSAVSYGLLANQNTSLPAIAARSGANSDITSMTALASINGGQIAGLRNKIINGSMSVDQRNTGAAQTFTAAAALAYAVDRWYGYCTGANVTGQRVAGTAPNQYNYRYTGAGSVTKIGHAQRIEAANSQDLAGTTATLAVDLANSLLTTVTWTAWYANTADTFGTLASPTRTQIATGAFTVTSTMTRYSTQISIPGAATTGVEVELSVGAQTSGTWTIGRAQLELGSVATVFEHRSSGLELVLCQRYFQVIGNATGTLIGSGTMLSATDPYVYGSLVCSMRTAPTGTVNFASSGFTQVTNGAASDTASSGATLVGFPTNYSLDIPASASQISNGAVIVRTKTATQNISFSSEL